MGLFTNLTLAKSRTKDEVAPTEPVTGITFDSEKVADPAPHSEKGNNDVQFTANAQAGVKRIEAATAVWSKWHLVGAYVM